ncbi:hypothetical protein RUM44_013942 [Polyplax serrata]|uniref:4-coumarate--CoA ligase n=1 Tax=Polyplax serrata TaxID=468196 RepID=A0ABR1BJH1_POLSC
MAIRILKVLRKPNHHRFLRKFSSVPNLTTQIPYFSRPPNGRSNSVEKKSVRFLSNSNESHSEHVVRSAYADVKIPNVPLHEFVFENLGQHEDKTAIECGYSGKKITFKELRKISEALADSFVNKFKLRKGDCFAIVLPNCPEYPALLLAASMSSLVSTTVNHNYTPVEISLQLRDTNSKLIFTTPENYQKCVEASSAIKMRIPIVSIQVYPDSSHPTGSVSFSELTKKTSKNFGSFDFRSDDDVVLPYSSGTSGLPKGVQLSHSNLIANIAQYQSVNELKANPNPETNQSCILAILPMYHIYGMVVVTMDSLRDGGRLISLPRFEPKLFLETIVNKKTQILYLVPPLIFFLSNFPGLEAKHMEHVQHVVSGAAPCGSSDIAKILEKKKTVQVSQGYGLTETSPVITISHKDRMKKIGSVGYPLPMTTVKVVDMSSGHALPKGQKGEIWVKGPQVMKGYLNRPEETQNIFDKDGWLKTGDVGYYDEEFDFYIVDRIKELIKVKGLQVAPAEIEEFIRAHPKVADVGVIGVNHPRHGEVPRAFVVVKDGVNCKEEEIQNYVKEMLSAHKHLLGGVKFVNEIPKSGAGKILRKKLRELNDEKFK